MAVDPLRRSRNSKTPCLPGFLPVIHDTQAVGVIGGMVVSNKPRTPSPMNASRRGINPFCINGSSTSNVDPSKPMKRTFLLITKDQEIQLIYTHFSTADAQGRLRRG